MDDYLALATDLAKQAGQLIKRNFDSNLQIEIKSDHTPVTQIDKQINDLVIRAVKSKFPDHGVIGEEGQESTGQEEFKWLFDPLDGTASFVLGMPHTTTIIGLMQHDELQLAVIYDPFTDRFYSAIKGQGAYLNGTKLSVNHDDLQNSYVLVEPHGWQLFQPLEGTGSMIESVGGAGYRAGLLVRGRVSAILQGSLSIYDVGPASLIVEEAGGKVTDLKGDKLTFAQPQSGGIILSNGVCHDQLVRALNQ